MSLTPIVVALFANSPLEDGESSGSLSRRTEHWFKTDSRRSGLIPRALQEEVTIDDYIDWALNNQVIFYATDGEYKSGEGLILTLARDFGIKIQERPVDKSELLIADEAFLSGTAAKITSITKLENYELPTSRPITEKLREKLIAITENREPKYRDWVYPINIS